MIALEEMSCTVEERVVRAAERAIMFAEFVELVVTNPAVGYELVEGVLVEKPMSAQLTHEKLYAWLDRVVGCYVEERDLGFVTGSRTPVQINEFGGRMPDLLFVRKDRLDIVHEKGVFGPPDLVIEIVSPNDCPADLSALEAAYRSIGVREIVFLDPQRQHIRVLRQSDGYAETLVTEGDFAFETLPGFHAQAAWLLKEPRPNMRQTVTALLHEAETLL